MNNKNFDLDTAIDETLKDLYLQAGDEGEAVIPVDNYCDNFETLAPEGTTVTVRLRWTEADCDRVIEKAKELTDLIGLIAEIGKPLTDLLETTPEILKPRVVECWNTYIEGFETGIAGRNDPDGDEAAQLQKHRATHADDAACRVGDSPYAYAVLILKAETDAVVK